MKYDSIQNDNSEEIEGMQMRPVLDEKILFSDGTADYRIPTEPEVNGTVHIRFRAAANHVDLVLLCHEEEQIEMSLVERDTDFEYYETEILLGEEKYEY